MAILDRIKNLGKIDFSKIDLNDLDLDNIGSWPMPIKVLLALLLFAALLGSGYWFYLKEMELELETAARQEQQLKESFSAKSFQAANLEQYRQQMKEMEESFGTLLQQLPMALWPDSRARQDTLLALLAVIGELDRSMRGQAGITGRSRALV